MTEALRSIKPLSRDSLRGVEPSTDLGDMPFLEMVKPQEIFVEENYQRDLSENSIALIRRIVAGFKWDRFKPPVCVRVSELDGALVCIDGQHTAIAAASHSGIDTIPVVIVNAPTLAARATAFVGHNRDRLALTQMAIYYSELAAGEELAVVMDKACKRAGARILNKAINLKNRQPAGVTIAVGTIRNIAKRKGEDFLARVLGLLTRAERGPIKADEISAVALILDRLPGMGPVTVGRLEEVVRSKTAERWAALAAVAVAEGGKRRMAWDALAALWTQEMGLRMPGAPRPEPKPVKKRPPNFPAGPVRKPVAAPPQASSAPRPEPRQPDPLPAVTSKPSSVPAAAPAVPVPPSFVEYGILQIDVSSGLVRRGSHRALVSSDQARLLALLAKVQPAFLESADLVSKLGWENYRLRAAAIGANPALSMLKLEIKSVMKTGWMLATV